MQRMPGPRQPQPFIEDITVHPTELPACVAFLQRLFDREGVEAVMVGHVGDGNIHSRPVLDSRDPGDRRIMQRIYDEVSAYVLGVRGTMAGEHGDGLVHTPRMQEMYGEEIYALFERIKKAFDPENLLNPGKKVGPAGAAALLVRKRPLRGRLQDTAAVSGLALRDPGLRERDRALPRLRGLQEHRRHDDVSHLQGHPARARVSRARRPTCCGPSSAGLSTRRAPTEQPPRRS